MIIKKTTPRRPDLIGNYNRTHAIEELALKWCKGHGVDYGYGDAESWPNGVEYILPGAIGVDVGVVKNMGAVTRDASIDHENLGGWNELDFIFSSHALEHIGAWRSTLTCWGQRVKQGGIIFLYLPHESVKEWLPTSYSEHKWAPRLSEVTKVMETIGFELVEGLDGSDSEGSFYCIYRKGTK